MSRKEEPATGALGGRIAGEATTVTGGDAGATPGRKEEQGVSISRARVILGQGLPGDSENMDEATPEALRNVLAGKLAEEFRVTVDVCSKSSGSGIGWNAHLHQAIAAEVNEVQWPFGRYFGTHQLLRLDIRDRNIA